MSYDPDRFEDENENRYRDSYQDRDLKHSGLGIASFIISLLVGVLLGGAIVAAGVMQVQRPGAFGPESPEAVVIGLGVCGGILAAVVGLILGIAGLCQNDRKKVFAVLGLVFNTLIILGVGCLFVIGLAAQNKI